MESNRNSTRPIFNYAIWLFDMNADDVFDRDRHLIIDSSLGLVEEDGDAPLPSLLFNPELGDH
ncbi:MAG: hypothetical protein M0Z36_11270 [Thermaerobacter sp.]|nr:hypothetical protein [Thermaerobacter sp.]